MNKSVINWNWKLTLILVCSIFYILTLSIDANATNIWIDNSQPYRQSINLSGASSTYSNYTVEFIINNTNVGANFNFSTDRDSIRFYYYNSSSDSQILIEHYFTLWNSGLNTADVLIKVPIMESSSDSILYMYYGNNLKTNIEDYCSVFIFCDNFDDGSINSKLLTTDQDLVSGTSFSESLGVLNITAGGTDTWTANDEYGSLYLNNISGNLDIRLTIVSQTNPNGWAKTGIMVKNDMTSSASSTGYSFMTRTPDNGYAFQYDGDNNGYLDGNSQAGAPTISPSHVRLVKDGNTHYGYYSKTNQETWNLITSSFITSTSATQDIGIGLTSHGGATLGSGTFDNFTIRRYSPDTISEIFNSEEENPKKYDNVAQIYDTTNQDGDSGPIDITFNSNDIIMSKFAHSTSTNSDRLYFNDTGLYSISYSCNWESTGANNRLIMENWLRLNAITDITPSKTSCYIRQTGTDGDRCTNAGTVLHNITASGDFIELRGDKLQGQSGTTQTSSDCMIYAKKITNKVGQVYDSTGGQNFDSSTITVNLDSSTHLDDVYSLNSDQITVNENGLYKVTYQVCSESTGQNNRQTPRTWLEHNGNFVEASYSYSYIRQTGSADRNCNMNTVLINMSNGDTVDIQHDKRAKEGSGTTITLIDQSWLHIEQLESTNRGAMFFENDGGQTVSDGSDTAIQLDSNLITSPYTSHIQGQSDIIINKSGLYEISYTLGWEDDSGNDRIVVCGYLRKDGITTITPSKTCDYSRGDTEARWESVSNSIVINLTKGDTIELMGNPTGSSFNVDFNSTSIVIIKLSEKPIINWESNNLDLGSQNYSLGNLTNSINLELYGDENNNVNIICDSGDCSKLSHNWINGNSIAETLDTQSITFSCDDSTYGNFSAIFNVTSNEDSTPNQLNVTCEMKKIYGNLDINLNFPLENSLTTVFQNQTFIANSTIFCNGVQNADCGNISIYFRSNSSGTFNQISTTPGANPLYSLDSQPQYCSLKYNESCDITWEINVTGQIDELYLLNTNASSNYSTVNTIESENATINISFIPAGAILWQNPTLFLGSGGLNLGNISSNTYLIPSQNHTNVTTICDNGNCSKFNHDWINGNNIINANNTLVSFSCDDSNIGDYWAQFNVTSNEDLTPDVINVSCSITQTFGALNVTLNNPPQDNSINVYTNETFNLKATILCEGTPGASCGSINATANYVNLIPNFGDGSDGNLTITSPNTIINNYTYLTGDENNGDIDILVFDSNEFNISDEILIIQMQNGSGNGNAGNYEFNFIKNISGNILTLENNLTNTYGSGTFDTTSASVTQIIRVPQYTNLTINGIASITAPAWNGYTGGIVVFRANGTVSMNGYVNVSQKGFRGGDCNGCGDSAWGDQGEGYLGTGTGSLSANGNGGGGGYGPSGYSGEPGAGGGYGTAGSDGTSTFTSTGGSAIGDEQLSKIFFGGGAGGGGDDDNPAIRAEYVDGAGAVIISANRITNARIEANGENGIGNGGAAGTTGGGAGGAIWLLSNNLSITNVNAIGGLGFNDGSDIGGDGGDGRIRLDYLTKTGTTSPSSGFNNSEYANKDQLTGVEYLQISTIIGDSPLYSTNSQPLICNSGNPIYEGNSCELIWNTNATGPLGSYYDITVNFESNENSVINTVTESGRLNILPPENVSILSPINNSKIFDTNKTQIIIRDYIGIQWAGYYLDGNTSNIINLINNSPYWNSSLNNIEYGLHNITILYNLSGNQFNKSPHYFWYIKNEQKKINKNIKSVGIDIYQIDLELKNLLNKSEDVNLIDFSNQNFNEGTFTPIYDFTNPSSGLMYEGDIFIWNLTTTAFSTNYFNYSITKSNGTSDYELLKQFIIGLE